MRHLVTRLCIDICARLGEGPSWDAERQRLSFVDILSGRVHVCDGQGRLLTTHEVGGHVGAALPAAGGGWLLVDQAGFGYLTDKGTYRRLLDLQSDRPELRFNDAKCDSRGRCLAGTMRYDEQPGDGVLYRFDPGPSAVPLLRGRGLCNGLGWRPDGRVLYFVDSLAYCVASHPYDPDDGIVGPEATVMRFDPKQGLPDGLCVDDEGAIWVAFYGGGCVHRYLASGQLDVVIELPVQFPTSMTFGGRNRDCLFITTAGGPGRPHGGDDEAAPASDAPRRMPGAGGIWIVEPGVTGPPATPWQPPHTEISAIERGAS